MTLQSSVDATVVAYRPDLAVLADVLNATADQVGAILVIANDGAPWSCPFPPNVMLAKQDVNLGLGAAYNLAAEWARSRGTTHLLLLDQDSVPAPGMVAALLQAFKPPGPVAAVGALWRDRRTGEDGYFIRRKKWGTQRYQPTAGEIVSVDFLISSGSVISLDALTKVVSVRRSAVHRARRYGLGVARSRQGLPTLWCRRRAP